MRSVLAALALLAGASAASAEVWLMREGRCGEYRSRWDVEQDQPGVWVGAADHVQVGGPCVARTGVNSRSRVRAVIVGQEFFAILQSEPASGAAVHSGQICSYYGPVRDDQVRGSRCVKEESVSCSPCAFGLRATARCSSVLDRLRPISRMMIGRTIHRHPIPTGRHRAGEIRAARARNFPHSTAWTGCGPLRSVSPAV